MPEADDQSRKKDKLDAALQAGFSDEASELDQNSRFSDSGPAEISNHHESVLHVLRTSIGAPPPLSLVAKEDNGPAPFVLPRGETRWSVPERIGRFQIEGEIARGGVGAVYKARDIDLGRDIALKVLLEDHSTRPDMVHRFVEEAQIGGQLQHPSIVPVHEMGLFAGERPYFAMKLVRGRTLASALEDRSSPAEGRQRFLGIFEKICEPVAYAHDRGVIHRDLKPSNVMLGSYGEVQVMDWGLAKVLARGGVADERRRARTPVSVSIHTVRSDDDGTSSLAGSVLGTPAYMAPEQARGEVDDLDERSDVFGLGAILCEILTGKPPYVGANSREIHRQAKRGYLDDAFRRLDGCGADRQLVQLAKKCLAFEARERPRNASAVAKEMRAYLESLEDKARRSEIRAARVRTRAAALLVSFLALVAVGASTLWVILEKRHASEIATLKAKEAISGVRGLVERARESETGQLEHWAAATEAAKSAQALVSPGIDPEVRNELEGLLSEIESERSRQKFLAALDTVHRGPGDYVNIDRAYTGAFFDLLGDDLLRIPSREAAERLRDAELDPSIVYSLDDWALVRKDIRRDWKPISDVAVAFDPKPWRVRLFSAIENNSPNEVAEVATSEADGELPAALLTVIASWLRNHQLDSDAEKLLRRAVRLEPDSARANLELGVSLSSSSVGRYEEGLRYLHAARALDPRNAFCIREIVWAYEGLSLFPDALELFMTMRGITREFWGGFWVREVLALLEKPDAVYSEALLDRTIRMLLDVRSQLHEDRRAGVRNEALRLVSVALGQALVLRYRERALEEGVKHLGEEILETQDDYDLVMLAKLLFASGRPHEAIRKLELAVDRPILGTAWKAELRRYRRRILPALSSCRSVDAALEDPDVLLEEGEEWRFFRGIRAPSNDLEWTLPRFDDSDWERGPTGIGYGDDDDATVLANMRNFYSTVFTRKRLSISGLTRYRSTVLRLIVDDGCLVWVNGRFVGGVRMDPESSSYDSFARNAEENYPPVEIEIGPALREGENTIAVLVANTSLDSSDLSFIPEIRAWPEMKVAEIERRASGYRAALEEQGAPALTAYLNGRVLELEGKPRAAAEEYRRSIRLDRSDDLPFLRLWKVLRAAGDHEAARRILSKEIERGAPSALRSLPPERPKPAAVSARGNRVVLKSSPFGHIHPAAEHVATRWSIRRADGDYDRSPVLDIVLTDSLTELAVPPSLLLPETDYFWRVAYLTSSSQVSQTSEEGSFSTGSFSFRTIPFDLSSVLNVDVVAVPGELDTHPLDGNSYALIVDGYPLEARVGEVVGLPADRRVGIYRLADYRGPNALQLSKKRSAPVRLSLPTGRFTALHFLATCGFGDVDLPVILEYEDGTSSRRVLRIDDWFDDLGVDVEYTAGGGLRPGISPALDGMDRFALFSGRPRFARDAALFQQVVETDPHRQLRAIVFLPAEIEASGEDAVFDLFAVTGIAAE